MKIESVDAFYLRMPDVRDVGDGSQDALLIRVVAGGFVGWGECDASPLPTIAALVAPMSHSACHPVLDNVLGAEIEGPTSVLQIHCRVKEACMDLLQSDHALSGIDIALWDLLGKREGAPVWSLFSSENRPKLAYASQLFGDSPADTMAAARAVAKTNFRAAKFGWGPFGRGSVDADREHLAAAREGLGPDIKLLIDAGCAFGRDVERAASRIPILEEFCGGWWEEPFPSGALAEYALLAAQTSVPLAGGEGAHNFDQARQLVDYGKVGFLQVDAGRIGGITSARQAVEYAFSRGVGFVNHTFTTNLALSASIQPYSDMAGFAEVPMAASPLAAAIGGPIWQPNSDGFISAPSTPGLGVEVEMGRLQPYLQEVEIKWQGRRLWPQS